jgi:DNA-binding IclR family transcriptional regulator
MSPPVQVTPEELRRHAAHLDGIADELETARQAGEATTPGPDAYGQLCVMVPTLLGNLQAPLVAAIAAASKSVRDTADAVIGAAADYEYVDEAAANSLHGTGGE